tara:strand:+ start:49410 stop:50474 length:1065 start_codon:yes stop_codon:yes gene_type:complete
MLVLPPPAVVLKHLFGVSPTSIVFGTVEGKFDRKTITAIGSGKAKDATYERFRDTLPPEIATYFRAETDAIKAAGEEAEFGPIGALAEATSWRVFFGAGRRTIGPGSVDGWPEPISRRLFALDDASVRVAKAAEQDEFSEAAAIIRTSAIGPYVDGPVLNQLRAGNSREAVGSAIATVQMAGTLFLFACFDKAFGRPDTTNPTRSMAARFMPENPNDPTDQPMPRFLRYLFEHYRITGKADAVRKGLGGSGSIVDRSEYRKIERWVSGEAFPEEGAFVDLLITVNRTQEVTAAADPDHAFKKCLYYGLRFLSRLSVEVAETPHAVPGGSFAGYFALYDAIYQSLENPATGTAAR